MNDKTDQLFALLKESGNVAVAYSGGVDSTFLVAAALKALERGNVFAIIARSPSMPHGEFDEALAVATQLGARCEVVTPGETEDPEYIANPPERCYICKRIIFRTIWQKTVENGFHVLLDGDNADDTHEHRPGKQAARELGVRSPLAECGFTKAEIRAVSGEWGLPTANKPALSCLATRIPHGTRITPEILEMIGRAEADLRVLGFGICRVRHHGDVARIEVQPDEIEKMVKNKGKVAEIIKNAGYKRVAADLEGYIKPV